MSCLQIGIPGPPGTPGLTYLAYADTVIQFRATAWDGSAHALRSQPGHLALVHVHGASGAYLQIYDAQLAGDATTPVWTELLDGEFVSRASFDPWLKLTAGVVLKLSVDAVGAQPYAGPPVVVCARHR